MRLRSENALEELARAKHLPVEFLKQFHVRSAGPGRIQIPYGRRDGQSCARTRIRYAGGEQKFGWDRASLTPSPKLDPGEVRESWWAEGPERILSDEAEATHSGSDHCQVTSS